MHRDNICMYMVHACFYVGCIVTVWRFVGVCCVAAVDKVKIVGFEPWSVEVWCMFV